MLFLPNLTQIAEGGWGSPYRQYLWTKRGSRRVFSFWRLIARLRAKALHLRDAFRAADPDLQLAKDCLRGASNANAL
ncbi:MAG: hypothetical protein H6Q99_2741 [Proteobacteria bacterium]|nr:hypothetical protein [Pseudomonadota bacterium]